MPRPPAAPSLIAQIELLFSRDLSTKHRMGNTHIDLTTVLTSQPGSYLPTLLAWDRAPAEAMTCPTPGVYLNSFQVMGSIQKAQSAIGKD